VGIPVLSGPVARKCGRTNADIKIQDSVTLPKRVMISGGTFPHEEDLSILSRRSTEKGQSNGELVMEHTPLFFALTLHC
jgi:hypothetical protein